VRINIHQLSNVPLVQGQFGVRWKFKGVQSVPGARSKLFRNSGHYKGKGKAVVVQDESTSTDDDNDDDEEAQNGSGETSPEDAITLNSGDDYMGVPSVVLSEDSHSTGSRSTSNTHASSSHPYARYLTSDWLPHSALAHGSPGSHSTFSGSHSPSLSSTTPVEAYAQARGMTEWVKLREHSAKWEHTLDVVVQVGVDRETSELHPNVLKLVVMQVSILSLVLLFLFPISRTCFNQRVIHGDPDAPHNPRLGALYLNLEQYASAGSVTRRYLLRETKINATLKVRLLSSLS
jgi:N-terminal C2 in EEIG1 and EHBP1 proteins